MANHPPSVRIGIYGPDSNSPGERHGCRLWPAGVAAALTYAEAEPIVLPERTRTCWERTSASSWRRTFRGPNS